MLVSPDITSWEALLRNLRINPTYVDEKDVDIIRSWCQKNIQSNFSGKSVKTIKDLFSTYLELNFQTSLETIIDKDLNYSVLHKAAKLGFDRFIDNCLTPADNIVHPTMLSKSKNGNTPLHLAALHGHLTTMEILLRQYPDAANEFNQADKLPIHLATVHNGKPEKLKCVRKLLMHTKREALERKDNIGMSLLLSLVDFDDVPIMKEVLIKNPKLLRLVNREGQNILHLAIIQQCPNVFNYFSSNNELMRQKTANNSTALHLACRYGNEVIIRNVLNQTQESTTCIDEHFKQPFDYLANRPELKSLWNDVNISPEEVLSTNNRI